MSPLIAMAKTLIRDEEAATGVEYALLIGGIALVVITAIYTLGIAVNTRYTLFQDKFGG